MNKITVFVIAVIMCTAASLGAASAGQAGGPDEKRPITEFFPDASLATIVKNKLTAGETLEMEIDAGGLKKFAVTPRELAAITGELECCGVGNVRDLTGVGYLTGVTSMVCCKTDLETIPAEIGKMISLESLNFGKAYEVGNFPPEIGKLKKLRYLRFCLTQIDSVPEEIGELENLEELYLHSNKIKSVPPSIGLLKKLKTLFLGSNALAKIPDALCGLGSLETLDLSHNAIERLPENIGDLKNLRELNLFNNRLKALPKSVQKLSKLKKLNVYDNRQLDKSYKKYLPKN